MLVIDQDALCEYCERDLNTCEGSICDETREKYIDEFGLVEDTPTSFGQLTIGDVVYMVSGNELRECVIDRIVLDAQAVGFEFKDCISVGVPKHATSNHDSDTSVFLNAREALAYYEDHMIAVIKTMAKTIAKFEEN